MGKAILTPEQLNFLEFIQKEQQITKRFYWTGGTVLSEFYLQHRLSEDIDLFNEFEEVNQSLIDAFLKKISPSLQVTEIKKSQFLGLVSYILVFKNSQKLKIDFNYYPFPRIEKGKKYKNLEIDSIYDIAVNKVHTMFMRTKARDFVDIYFIMKTIDYHLDQLIRDAKVKFDWHIDKVTLASQFMKVKEIKDLPKMLLPFNQKDMEKFYLKLAKSLEEEILK
ncbi:nucleotidyl transferase AbiEii/AbiGii toxin family protein [Candidatus Microgenomates bacterium]|nr:nucleotidyl transferase AbiEii/AbiGii toxin family protein [Candidatus Microgenomates bacterium]